MPAFVVFNDTTLQLLAEHRPGSAQELLAISGIGRAKLDRYGEEVLALVAGHRSTSPSGSAEKRP